MQLQILSCLTSRAHAPFSPGASQSSRSDNFHFHQHKGTSMVVPCIGWMLHMTDSMICSKSAKYCLQNLMWFSAPEL